MIKYRPHRGSLNESMTKMREFNDLDEMYNYIISDWNNSEMKPFGKEDLSISDNLGADERSGWKETRYVCVKRMGSKIYEHPQCIGMCSFE